MFGGDMMRKLLPVLALLAFAAVSPAFGQHGKPRPAQTLLKEAIKKADTSHRTVFVLFDASW
jgi:hypothetical protein